MPSGQSAHRDDYGAYCGDSYEAGTGAERQQIALTFPGALPWSAPEGAWTPPVDAIKRASARWRFGSDWGF
jgi:hypothetical protein